jgi:hypothetical protein
MYRTGSPRNIRRQRKGWGTLVAQRSKRKRDKAKRTAMHRFGSIRLMLVENPKAET